LCQLVPVIGCTCIPHSVIASCACWLTGMTKLRGLAAARASRRSRRRPDERRAWHAFSLLCITRYVHFSRVARLGEHRCYDYPKIKASARPPNYTTIEFCMPPGLRRPAFRSGPAKHGPEQLSSQYGLRHGGNNALLDDDPRLGGVLEGLLGRPLRAQGQSETPLVLMPVFKPER